MPPGANYFSFRPNDIISQLFASDHLVGISISHLNQMRLECDDSIASKASAEFVGFGDSISMMINRNQTKLVAK